jgi:hypothetical protein
MTEKLKRQREAKVTVPSGAVEDQIVAEGGQRNDIRSN